MAETAARVRKRIELIPDAARGSGLRNGDNPARWRGHFDKLLPARSKLQVVKHPRLEKAWRRRCGLTLFPNGRERFALPMVCAVRAILPGPRVIPVPPCPPHRIAPGPGFLFAFPRRCARF